MFKTTQKHAASNAPAGTETAPFEAELVQDFNTLVTSGAYTKRSSLRVAIINTIEASNLTPGDMLPSEQRLASLLELSLGTVQAALKQLVDRGYVSRRRGDGTRVLDRRTLPSTFWHVRVVDPESGSPMLLQQEELFLDTVAEYGLWTRELDIAPGDTMVRRTFIYTNDVRVAQEIYFTKKVTTTIKDMGLAELQYTNIREFLFPQHAPTSTLQSHQKLRLTAIPAIVQQKHDLADDTLHLELQAQVLDPNEVTLYIQRIYAPPEQCGFAF